MLLNKLGLADESKDCSKTEQLAIVLRYVEIDTPTQHEHFLTYIKVASQNSESLSAYILDELDKCGLNPNNIVSQGYDGASVMSGRCSGVQTRIRAIAPMAVYVHCYAHCLNLVLVYSTKSVPQASEFFALLEILYVFMSTSNNIKFFSLIIFLYLAYYSEIILRGYTCIRNTSFKIIESNEDKSLVLAANCKQGII